MDLRINSGYTFTFSLPSIDSEEKEIAQRLRMYGQTPTGDKSTDRAKLRRIEEQKAKENNIVTGKFLTVSRQEEERIQEKKKEVKKTNNKDLIPSSKENSHLGAKYTGEQIYLAIKMRDTNYSKRRIV